MLRVRIRWHQVGLVILCCMPFAAAQVSGTGTTNFIPIWTNGTTLGSSALFQSGGNVSIGNTAPAAKLDISGGAFVRGTLHLPALGIATAAKGFNSQAIDFVGSAFNSSIATAVPQHFQWQTEPVNNNTASPSGKFNLLFAPGAATPAETGVSFSNAGVLSAKRLVSTIATGTAPFAVTSTTLVTNLNANFLGGLASTAFARLAGSNSFTGSQSITGNLSVSGTVTGNGSGLTNVNAASLGGASAAAFALVGSSNTFSAAQTINNTLTVTGGQVVTNSLQYTDTDVAGALEPPLLINAVDCCDFGNRMIWAHSPLFPQWGIYYDDTDDIMIWQQSVSGTQLMTLSFDDGNLNVLGTITAGAKDFKIDHPTDPSNKFLYHASVESAEMMNIYTGNVMLDDSGEGVVSLPKWFEALNADFRYSLTAIGAAAPNLHVGTEIANHQFTIAGGAPGMKVSWQVTAVRHDAYAKAHPLVVEVKKSQKERGHYLHPDAYGVPKLTQEQMLQQR